MDIGQILVEKRLLNAKGADVVGKKVAEIMAKKAAAAPPAPVAPMGAAAATKSSAPAPASTAVSAATVAAPPPTPTETGEIQLDEGGNEARGPGWRPSDAEWVENTGPGGNGSAKAPAALPDDIEQIELVGEDELSATSGASKIVVDNRPHIKDISAKPAAPGTAAPGTPGTAPPAPGNPRRRPRRLPTRRG